MRRLLVLASFLFACSSPSPASETPPEPPAASAAPTTTPATTPTPTPEPAPEAASDDVVLAHHGEIEACAASAHDTTPALAGNVEMHWTVQATGTVSDVVVDARTLAPAEAAPALEQCMVAAIGTWTYPTIAPEHVSTVHHTFTIAQGLGHGAGLGVSEGFGTHDSARITTATRVGEVSVDHGLPMEVVRRVARRHVNEARFCYERELATTASLAGTVTLHFGVDAGGAVTTPTVGASEMTAEGAADGGEAAQRLGACLTTALGRWSFPVPEGGPATVNLVLSFANEVPAEPPPPPATGGGTGTGTIGLGTLGTVGS